MSNVDLVTKFVAAFNVKDLDAIGAAFSEDAVYHNMPVAPIRGRANIRKSIDGYMTPATQVEWRMLAIAQAANGTVLTERLDRFLMAGKWVELPVMGAFECANGKITSWRDYFDMNQFTSQMPGRS